MAAGDGFAPSTALSKSAELLVTPSRNELVEPDVVATSPNRIKSPVPVFCGFSSEKWWAREDLHPATAGLADSRSAGSSIPAQPLAQKILKLEPPAGAAPAGFLYKRNPQAAAWRRNGRSPQCCPGARRAYETCLSAGSTASVGARPPLRRPRLRTAISEWSPHPELHRADSLTERTHR